MKTIHIKYQKARAVRERLLLYFFEKIGPVHERLHSTRQPWNLQREDLLQYRKGTLAWRLGFFLQMEDLQPIPRAERHDVFHILLGFGTDVPEEAAMQFFRLGNGQRSLFAFGTSMLAAAVLPEQWVRFWKAYKKGKSAINIAHWDFQQLLNENFEDIRRIIFKQPTKNVILVGNMKAASYI